MGSQEEVTRKLRWSPFYLDFVGVFRINILTGKEGEAINKGSNSIPSVCSNKTLFSDYSRDKESYEIQKIMRRLTVIITILTGVLTILTAILAFGAIRPI